MSRSGSPWRPRLPRRLVERLQATRRDLSMVLDAATGRRRSPVIPRPPRRSSAASTRGAIPFRLLRVTDVVHETPDATTLRLVDVTGDPLDHLPGQFLTVELTVAGERLRRAYSLSNAPGQPLSITVKRMPSGRASNHIRETVKTGDLIRARGPSGHFTVTPDASASRRLVLIAGGSGITPIRAIAEAVLEREPGSRAALIYGNRREQDIIFRIALETLQRRHPDRLTLDLVLDEPPAGWAGGVGRLDEDTLASRLDQLDPALLSEAAYYLCGPEPMRAQARALLRARSVPADRVFEEAFVTPGQQTDMRPLPTEPQEVTYRWNGSSQTVEVQPGQTLLDAGLGAGIPLPYSCTMGGCGACRMQLVEGTVQAEEPNCLRPEERDAGWVLTCVSRPASKCRVKVPS